MPKYDFRCDSCNIVEELLFQIDKSDTIPPCSLCGANMRRLYAPPAIRFKGPGFYKTGG